jgi:hypothetical protein
MRGWWVALFDAQSRGVRVSIFIHLGVFFNRVRCCRVVITLVDVKSRAIRRVDPGSFRRLALCGTDRAPITSSMRSASRPRTPLLQGGIPVYAHIPTEQVECGAVSKLAIIVDQEGIAWLALGPIDWVVR